MIFTTTNIGNWKKKISKVSKFIIKSKIIYTRESKLRKIYVKMRNHLATLIIGQLYLKAHREFLLNFEWSVSVSDCAAHGAAWSQPCGARRSDFSKVDDSHRNRVELLLFERTRTTTNCVMLTLFDIFNTFLLCKIISRLYMYKLCCVEVYFVIMTSVNLGQLQTCDERYIWHIVKHESIGNVI